MKKILSTILVLAMILGMSISAIAAPYVPDYEREADILNSLGLLRGNEYGDYELGNAPNRTEALVMLIRLLGKENDALNGNYSHPFTDVPAWANSYVGYAYKNGLTNGVSKTLFGATTLCDAKMYATFIFRALGYNDAEGEFEYETATYYAYIYGLIDKPYQRYLDIALFLRDDMVMLSYQALLLQMNDSEDCLLQQLVKEGAVDKDLAAPYIGIYLYDYYEMIYYFADYTFEEIITTEVIEFNYGSSVFTESYKSIWQSKYDENGNFCVVNRDILKRTGEPEREYIYGYSDGYVFAQSYDENGTMIRKKALDDEDYEFYEWVPPMPEEELVDFDDIYEPGIEPTIKRMVDYREVDKTLQVRPDGSVAVAYIRGEGYAEEQARLYLYYYSNYSEQQIDHATITIEAFTESDIFAADGIQRDTIEHLVAHVNIGNESFTLRYDYIYEDNSRNGFATLNIPNLSLYELASYDEVWEIW